MNSQVLSIDIFEKHYELPRDIITYIDEHHRFETYRQELLAYFMDNFYDYQNLSEEVERKTYEKFRHYGNLCVQKLIANDIYNATVDELVGSTPANYTWKCCSDASTNDGVKMFYKALCDSMMEQANAEMHRSFNLVRILREILSRFLFRMLKLSMLSVISSSQASTIRLASSKE